MSWLSDTEQRNVTVKTVEASILYLADALFSHDKLKHIGHLVATGRNSGLSHDKLKHIGHLVATRAPLHSVTTS
jgi:hypothetical protein